MKQWFGVVGLALALIFMFRMETRLDVIQSQVEDLNKVVKTNKGIAFTSADVDCLTKNIYYEAGVEDSIGKYAVGHITMNRLSTGYWGKSVCEVVYAKDQFSWTRLKKLPKPDNQKWVESLFIARDVLQGHRIPNLNRSLFYHADYIKDPHWVDKSQKVTQIGRHIFYNKAKNSWLAI
jgi:spore germination cell wall hydrolase CwlJ-like protein